MTLVLTKHSPPIVTRVPGSRTEVTGREENKSRHRFVFSNFTSLFKSFNMHFDTSGLQRSFVHSATTSLLSRVPAAFASRAANQPKRGARRLETLELCETLTRNTKEKQYQHVNTTHYTRRLYILFCKSLSARGRSPGQNAEHHPLKRQGNDVNATSDVNRSSVSGAVWASARNQSRLPKWRLVGRSLGP